MKKFLAMICAAALAVLCAVPAFAEATPGQVANDSFVKAATATSQAEAEDAVKEMTASITSNPTLAVSNNMAVVAKDVINQSNSNEVVRTYTSDSVSNYVTVEAPDASKVTVNSLKKENDTTWVLNATTNDQPEMGVLLAVYGLENGSYQLVYVGDDGTRTTYDTQVGYANNAVVFWIPHFTTYEIVKVAGASSSGSTSSGSTSSTTVTANNAAAVDAEFYTCPACGYHDWTGTEGGYKCDHCGHIEAKDLSKYPNVKGTATLPTTTASAAAASGKVIKATGADMNLVVLVVLAIAAAMVAGFACVVRKQGLGK